MSCGSEYRKLLCKCIDDHLKKIMVDVVDEEEPEPDKIPEFQRTLIQLSRIPGIEITGPGIHIKGPELEKEVK